MELARMAPMWLTGTVGRAGAGISSLASAKLLLGGITCRALASTWCARRPVASGTAKSNK